MRALVIEGGGMKAAYANGVLAAFEEADHHPWDLVCGTSAGGALAAWFSARQARFAMQTWSYARDGRILSYRRGLTGRGPILDHGALIDIIYEQEHPLDQEALAKAPWPVVVTAVDVETGRIAYQDVRGERPLDWLKATGRLPLGSGPPVEIDGTKFLDGGIVDPIPVRWAVQQGASQITLILNKPPGPKRPDPRVFAEAAARRYPVLRDHLMRHQELKQEAVAYAQDPPEGVSVEIIHPLYDTGLSRLTRAQDKLDVAMQQGRRDGLAHVFDETPPRRLPRRERPFARVLSAFSRER